MFCAGRRRLTSSGFLATTLVEAGTSSPAVKSNSIEDRMLLVTTALEETWGADDSILFLGEWCRVYDRRAEWSKRRHQVVRNHWDDRKKLKTDHDYLAELHGRLLETLSSELNSHHGTAYPRRYWQTILDPWLLTYVAVIWDRWECLRVAFETHENLEMAELEPFPSSIQFFDYSDFIQKILGDFWNYRLFLEIIESEYGDRCKTRKSPRTVVDRSGSTELSARRSPSRSLKQRTVRFIDGFLGKCFPENRAVIFDAYFPLGNLVKLCIGLKQIPRLFINEFEWPIAINHSTEFNARDPLGEKIAAGVTAATPFESFLLKRIVNDIPFVYLEGYTTLQSKTSKIAMRPRAIFTANAHWGNELFKLWSAEQVLLGTKLVTMEHGGCIPPAFSSMSFEENIADRRTTWSMPYHNKHVRLPANKLATVDIKSTQKYIAVLDYDMPRYCFRAEASPKAGQALIHHDMVCQLYESLDKNIQANFLVRPYPGCSWGWNMRQRLIDKLGEDRISSESNYYKFLSQARVIVCTYPQTTFSEAMASGLPSILCYPAHLWETIPEMDPLLDSLKAAKILFTDATMAATHINAVWNNPIMWWESPVVVQARSMFRKQALTLNDNWMAEWTTFIKGMVA